MIFALFFRSMHFFDGVLVISEWHFLQPGDAVEALERLTGFSLRPLAITVGAVFPALVLYYLVAAVRKPCRETLIRSVIAAMAFVAFSAVSHLWPWFVLWVLAPAALLPRWWVSRFVAGVALLAQFTLPFWWLAPLESYKDMAALVMYCGALLWVYATRTHGTDRPPTQEFARATPITALCACKGNPITPAK